MARKYKRSSNGRFAGGGGAAGTGTKVSAGRGKPSVTGSQKRVVARKGSAAAKNAKTTTPSNTRLQKAGKVAKGVGKFAAKNPRLVIGVAGYGAALAITARGDRNGAKLTSGLKKFNDVMDGAQKYAQGKASDKRGIGGKPGANLRASKRNVRGAYKIRSR